MHISIYPISLSTSRILISTHLLYTTLLQSIPLDLFFLLQAKDVRYYRFQHLFHSSSSLWASAPTYCESLLFTLRYSANYQERTVVVSEPYPGSCIAD